MYYISRNYKSLFNAAGKAKTDCEIALQNLGFENLGFKQSSIPNSAIGTIKNFFGITLGLLRLPFKSVICTQYPNNKFRQLILFFAKFKSCKIITIVHDVRSLKGRVKDVEKELSKIVCSDVIEHVANPDELLASLKSIKGTKYYIISTPDRGLIPQKQYGPPLNKTHMREWNFKEFNDE